jgi:hypothetical protein
MAPEIGEPLKYLPLLPRHVLKQHKIIEPLDTRFRSAARMLQCLWRCDQKLQIGAYLGSDGKRRKLGSRISDSAGQTGANFITPEIAKVAWREMAYREPGALIDEERFLTNLLSSQTLTFNLFAPWRLDADLACIMATDLMGTEIFVRRVRFETSPGRGDPKFSGDFTAFDAAVFYVTPEHKRGVLCFEIKYSEALQEPNRPLNPRYDQLAETSGLFIDHADPALRANPLQQLFRQTLLAKSMIDADICDEAHIILVGPELNHQVQAAAKTFAGHFRAPDEGAVRFHSVSLERFIDTFRQCGQPEHAAALHARYADFWRVDAELERNIPRPKNDSPSDRKEAEMARITACTD